jgi:hypothetical protein
MTISQSLCRSTLSVIVWKVYLELNYSWKKKVSVLVIVVGSSAPTLPVQGVHTLQYQLQNMYICSVIIQLCEYVCSLLTIVVGR